jgi:hypothetical protein
MIPKVKFISGFSVPRFQVDIKSFKSCQGLTGTKASPVGFRGFDFLLVLRDYLLFYLHLSSPIVLREGVVPVVCVTAGTGHIYGATVLDWRRTNSGLNLCEK